MTTLTRRSFFGIGIKVTVAGTALAVAACAKKDAGAASTACASESSLSSSEWSLRQSAHYAEKSPKPAETCSVCEFFTAEGTGPCGQCKIFNGPANSGGHCDSWAKKAA
jgi:hypothetical protein